MAADDDSGSGESSPHHAAHLAHLADVDDDRRDAHDIVVHAGQLACESLARGEIEHRGGSGDVLLDHHDAPGAMKHAQRERSLLARYLVVVQLHGIDGAAAELVVLRIRTEYGAEQYARIFALGVDFHSLNSPVGAAINKCTRRRTAGAVTLKESTKQLHLPRSRKPTPAASVNDALNDLGAPRKGGRNTPRRPFPPMGQSVSIHALCPGWLSAGPDCGKI